MAEEKTLHVRIRVKDYDALRRLPIAEMDTGCMGGIRREDDGSVVFEALVRQAVLERIEEKDAALDVVADRSVEGPKRQKEVGRGNRFKGDDWIPRGLGKKVRDGGRQ